jgi:hypothetical protein
MKEMKGRIKEVQSVKDEELLSSQNDRELILLFYSFTFHFVVIV